VSVFSGQGVGLHRSGCRSAAAYAFVLGLTTDGVEIGLPLACVYMIAYVYTYFKMA